MTGEVGGPEPAAGAAAATPMHIDPVLFSSPIVEQRWRQRQQRRQERQQQR